MIQQGKTLFLLWYSLAALIGCTAIPLGRTKRILNEPGDITKHGKQSLPFLKRQQIIYLLNNSTSRKRTKQPDRPMESYAKELTADGKVITSHVTRFMPSEDFRGGGGSQEIAVSKEDGPPLSQKQIYNTPQDIVKQTPAKPKVIVEHKNTILPSNSNPKSAQIISANSKDSSLFAKRTQFPMNKQLVNSSDSSTLRVKNSFIGPLQRLSDGEILMPPTRRITPNLFEIDQNEVRNSRFSPQLPRDNDREPVYPENRPIRRWRGPSRWVHRRRYNFGRRRRPMYMNHRPDVVYVPMYSRGNQDNPAVLPYESGPSPEMRLTTSPVSIQPNAAYGGQVMLQPLTLPSQPAALQMPFQQQPDARSGMYGVPIATAPAPIPQPIVYPVVALPAMQQPQQFVQLQPVTQQTGDDGSRGLPASHWEDESGHTRSEVGEELPRPPPDYDGYRRYDDDSYRPDYGNEQQFHSEREYEDRDDRNWDDRDYPDRSQYYERRPYMEENADSRSEQPEVPPPPLPPAEDNSEDDDDDENETDAYQHDLQDSNEPVQGLNDDGPPEIERDDSRPIMNYRNPQTRRLEAPSVVEVPPPSRERMPFRFGYPHRMTMNTYSRDQLIGSPLRENPLPRLNEQAYRRTQFQSPGAQISEMTADEARFRERMRLELQAKDTIPRGRKTSGFKNVLIRLNGIPLESASELRSRIVHGRIIPGRGKTIRSKGPMKIRVSHRGEGKHRIKIIDIFSPKRFSVVDSRSKIIKGPSTTSAKKTIIHRKANLIPNSRIKPFVKTQLKKPGQRRFFVRNNKSKDTKKNIPKIRTLRKIDDPGQNNP